MTFRDFTPLVDFSLIEAAVSAFFVAVPGGSYAAAPVESATNRQAWLPGTGNIGFYTAQNLLVNQASRPRVMIRLHAINHRPGAYAIDANGSLREKAWIASMDFGIVTEPSYTSHTAQRAAVLAIIPQLITISADGTLYPGGGINALLAYHQVSEFFARSVTTDVVPAEGAYMSTIPVQLAFNVLPSAWPAGMQTY